MVPLDEGAGRASQVMSHRHTVTLCCSDPPPPPLGLGTSTDYFSLRLPVLSGRREQGCWSRHRLERCCSPRPGPPLDSAPAPEGSPWRGCRSRGPDPASGYRRHRVRGGVLETLARTPMTPPQVWAWVCSPEVWQEGTGWARVGSLPCGPWCVPRLPPCVYVCGVQMCSLLGCESSACFRLSKGFRFPQNPPKNESSWAR